MKKEYEDLLSAASTPAEGIDRLEKIIKILRKECPWDRVQTHESLTTCMIEEAYETVDAINSGNDDSLREELGDVMLQVIFHSALSEEEERFSLIDVINEECDKMIRRHPHVFSDGNVKTIDKTLEKWENIKSREHGNISYSEGMRQVPKVLPALMRSCKIQSKASRVGFDWPDIDGPMNKIAEEYEELKAAYSGGNREEIEEELGDLLFSVANISRFLEADPEAALNRSTEKFIQRFAYIEDRARAEGKCLEDMSLEDMDRLWVESKKL